MVGVSATVDDSTIEPRSHFLVTIVMDVGTGWMKILNVCTISLFSQH